MSEARKMIDRIPPGQPVHSTRDRNLREKSLEKVRKARELYDLADAIDATKARKESPEDALPAGWTEASPGGMAASRDKTTGGIVDKNIATGKWFLSLTLEASKAKTGLIRATKHFLRWPMPAEWRIRGKAPTAKNHRQQKNSKPPKT
jgi:hypothetical protein